MNLRNLLRRRTHEPTVKAITINRGNGQLETVFVRERHAPHIARLVERRRNRKAA